MLGPGCSGGGPGRARGCEASKQPSGTMSAFPKAPHFSCFHRNGGHRSNRDFFLGEKGTQRIPGGSSILTRSIYEVSTVCQAGTGVSIGHIHAIQPGMGVQAESSIVLPKISEYIHTGWQTATDPSLECPQLP